MREILRSVALVSTVALALGAAGCAARATNQPADGAETTETAKAQVNSTDATPPAAVPATTADATRESAPADGPAIASSSALDAGGTPAPASAAAADWTQWRGPNRDGQVSGFAAPRAWPKALKEEWRVTVGVGHSSPLAAGGRVYVFARQGEEEVLMALDAATGRPLWRSAHAVAYEMNPAARGHGKGPKSTPAVGGGRLFTLGITGVLSAHDAGTGKILWRKDFSKQYSSTSPLYGTAMSPAIEGNLVIAHVGGHDRGALTAFDAATGAVRWAYDAEGPAYSSPIVVTLAGERQVVTFTQREFVAVSAATGKPLWKMPAKTGYDTNSVTAVAYKDMLILSLEDQGVLAVRPERRGGAFAAREVWRNAENELYMNSPVLDGNRLFGLSARKKGQFFCLDADTGKTVWQGPGRMGENASILNLGGTLLLMTNDARLIVLPAGAAGYSPVAQYTVASTETWAHPLPLGDRILVKDETTLAALSIPGR